MALGAPVVLAPLLLEHDNRACPPLIDDLRRDLRTLDQGLTDLDALVAVDESHVAQFHCAADVACEAFDVKEGAVLDPVLLAACFHACVHECFLSDRTPLCITVISKVTTTRRA